MKAFCLRCRKDSKDCRCGIYAWWKITDDSRCARHTRTVGAQGLAFVHVTR